MRARRFLGLATLGLLLGAAACTAIAGIDGDYLVVPDGGREDDGSTTSSTSTSSTSSSSGDVPDGSTSDVADTGIVDTGPPAFDASLPIEFEGGNNNCDTTTSGQQFCWDFNGADDNVPPRFGFNRSIRSGSWLLEVRDGGPLPEAAYLHAAITGTGPNRNAGLAWRQWADDNDTTPLPVAPGESLELRFTLTIKQATAMGLVGVIRMDDEYIALGVLPAADCPGDEPCLATVTPGRTDVVYATRFRVGGKYRVRIFARRPNAGTWGGEVIVGGRTLGTRADGIFRAGDAAVQQLEFGVLEAGATGETAVDIDDIRLVRFAP
ncbi:MAG: hypothetical protein KIT84_25105 [Labilithrix sp.]|nr:hypothetical protein [Labilithrix sp.]MCW5814330.1 hypothetical protein [Labilithrix sp.]